MKILHVVGARPKLSGGAEEQEGRGAEVIRSHEELDVYNS